MRTLSAYDIKVTVPINGQCLPGELYVPARATGLVLMAHGSGTTFRSVQNRRLARALQGDNLVTLSLDLVDIDEAHDRHNVFDVDLQASRLMRAAQWLRSRTEAGTLPLGYFGSGIGSGAALLAAAKDPHRVSAVVSGGGRPDMALYWLPRVEAPTLLIVAERDLCLIECNREAYAVLKTEPKKIIVVRDVADLLEEDAGFRALVRRTREWFLRHLSKRGNQSCDDAGTEPYAAGRPLRRPQGSEPIRCKRSNSE